MECSTRPSGLTIGADLVAAPLPLMQCPPPIPMVAACAAIAGDTAPEPTPLRGTATRTTPRVALLSDSLGLQRLTRDA